MLVVEVDRVHQLAIDVQLQLVVGAVADPDRTRAAIAVQVIQGLLGQVASPVYPVHQLQGAVGFECWQRDSIQPMNWAASSVNPMRKRP